MLTSELFRERGKKAAGKGHGQTGMEGFPWPLLEISKSQMERRIKSMHCGRSGRHRSYFAIYKELVIVYTADADYRSSMIVAAHLANLVFHVMSTHVCGSRSSPFCSKDAETLGIQLRRVLNSLKVCPSSRFSLASFSRSKNRRESVWLERGGFGL